MIKNAQKETELIAALDAKNLADFQERQPEITQKIRDLVSIGYSAHDIGRLIRRDNPQMWVESKFAESIARAILEQEKE